MRKSPFILLLAALALGACESVKFKELSLYDTYEEPTAAEKTDPVIFEDAVGTLWSSLEGCGEFEISNETAHSGNSSIKISWDKGKGCEWIGFGNSFNNWAAADMSKDRFTKALTFYARTQTKVAGAIPIVAAMEDFGGGGAYHFVDAGKYLRGLELDTTWKQIIVPLWDFPVHEDEVDIYSIKQFKFQLEGAGSYYLDDIRLIDYTKEEYEKFRAEVELMKPKGTPNQTIYREGKFADDAWGYENNNCQKLSEISDHNNKMISWVFADAECTWSKWGMNWNDWYQVNFRGILETATLQFRVKVEGGAAFKINLEDYRYHSSTIWESKGVVTSNGEWKLIEIPLKSLKLDEKGFVLDQIKQLTFEGVNGGEVYLDDIKITGS